MKQYNYPVRYINAPSVKICPADIFKQRVVKMEEYAKMTSPITGETGIDGVLLDFNYGLRLQIPEGNWHVKISDAESEYVFIDDDISAATLISWEKFFIEWEVILWLDGEPVFYHQFDPHGQQVHFRFPTKTLGDTLALLPYVEAFRKQFDCTVTCTVEDVFYDILDRYYPNVRRTPDLPDDSYACFYMQFAFNFPFETTEDAAAVPMLRFGRSILRRVMQAPKVIFTPTKPREIQEPYVCIAVHASCTSKSWLNPNGWSTVVAYLKELGYRVLCIDKNRVCTNHGMTVEQPEGVEDMSGDYDLIDRVNQIAYADFFIGVGSGLSWLAWAVDVPVIMISGISEPWYEFDTPYRVHNPLVCHGCFNLVRDRDSLFFCPFFRGTKKAFQCSKKISARQVVEAIDRLIADHNLLRGSS